MSALIVRDGPNAGERLEVEAEVVLGREAQEFLHHDGEVSRRHAAVRPGAAGLEIEDLGSSNGTFVNDQRIVGATVLAPGDVVRVGQTTLEVEATPATAGTVIREVPEAAPAADAEPPQAEVPAPPPDVTAPLDAGPGPVPAGPPADSPPLGPPPMAPLPAAAPQAAQVGPPPYGPPPGMAGLRPGIVTAAGIVLILAGVISLGFGVWRAIELFDLRGDVAVFESIFGPTDLEGQLLLLIVFAVLGVIAGILTIIGGIRFLARSRAGVVLGLIGTIGMIVAWAGYLIYSLIQEFSPDAMEWAGSIGSLLGAGAGLGLLLGGRRHVAPPMTTPWAA